MLERKHRTERKKLKDFSRRLVHYLSKQKKSPSLLLNKNKTVNVQEPSLISFLK